MVKGSGKAAGRNKKDSHAFPRPKGPTSGKETARNALPLKLQQRCLDLFRDAFHPGPDDHSVLQEIKGHLYNRDFVAAFGKEDYLRVYASRWSPSRALAYLPIFQDIGSYLSKESDDVAHTVCIGGGAGGELVALSALSSLEQNGSTGSPRPTSVTLLDIADWSKVTANLQRTITTPPELSKYTSQAKKDANKALVTDEALTVSFKKLDVLDSQDQTKEQLSACCKAATLVTFMFTLNELYSISMTKTQQLLQHLTDDMTLGSCLLVVDSPGSYSTVSINGAEKKYPMQWLLDFTLLGQSAKADKDQRPPKWEKLTSDDSRWFRLDDSLQYPIDLEDMRYQIYLYRRISAFSMS
jgi:25S rRNA (uracil2843-N3)-methyltransferase